MKNKKYAIVLNGEWYSTADSWEKACDIRDRIYSAADDEDDFKSYYGSYPTVDIVPINDQEVNGMVDYFDVMFYKDIHIKCEE